jgi:hypothetical protein
MIDTMENQNRDFSHINGWGVDANPQNDPTYPMKKWNGDDHKRINWERPPLQQVDVELLRSNERPNNSAVFGTSTPPSGLSGAIRRYAFRYSESSYGHWLPLVLADRINVVEGIVDDLKRGHIPNIIAERGWTAEWKYNRQGFIKKLAIAGAVTTAIVLMCRGNSKARRR